MPLSKLKKFVNLALNNANANEASTAARQLFSRLDKLGIKFKPSLFNLTLEEGIKLYNLSGRSTKTEKQPEQPKVEPREEAQSGRPHTLAQILETIHKSHGLDIPSIKARATLRRKMSSYPGTKFNDEEACQAEEILIKHFC